jgi:peptide/nickel transport system substrate-binding protein
MSLPRVLALALFVALSVGCRRNPSAKREPRPQKPRAYTGDTLPTVEAQGAPEAGGVLRIAMGAEPPSLNYQLDPLDAWGKKVDELILESLARPDVQSWDPVPRLAERWEVSDDRLTLTFFLRKGVRWHDGKPFTADDVIFTFMKLMDPTSKTMAIRSYLEPVASFEKVDELTVRFHLKRPYWYAFNAIAEIFILPKHIYVKGDFNTHPANRSPIGTGRYRFERWVTGDEIVLQRNPDYFGARATLDKIVFKYAPDPTVRTQMLRRGDVDVIEKLTPEEWRDLTEDSEIATSFHRLRHIPASVQWIGWNEDRPLFADRRVRRAMTMLIDREDIVGNLRLGLDTLAVAWFYPGAKEYSANLKPLPYDPDAAVELLEEVGWTDRNGDGIRDKDGHDFNFTFLYPAGPPFYEQLAGLLINEFKKVGIVVQTSRVDWPVYTERLRKHEFDACSLLWEMAPRNDPYQVWHSSEVNGGSNFVSFRNAETDRLLEDARTEFDEARRLALYHRFNEVLVEEQPYTMLFYRYNLSLVSKRFGGIISTPYGVLSYADFCALKADTPTP